jgi:hypothetical protein
MLEVNLHHTVVQLTTSFYSLDDVLSIAFLGYEVNYEKFD